MGSSVCLDVTLTRTTWASMVADCLHPSQAPFYSGDFVYKSPQIYIQASNCGMCWSNMEASPGSLQDLSICCQCLNARHAVDSRGGGPRLFRSALVAKGETIVHQLNIFGVKYTFSKRVSCTNAWYQSILYRSSEMSNTTMVELWLTRL